jgi:predicted acetyltransferase
MSRPGQATPAVDLVEVGPTDREKQPSKIEPDTLVWFIQEFFILRRYRRMGLGRTAANLVIQRHPGTWEVTETPSNGGAIAFWRAILRTYQCRELSFDDPKWGQRPLQRFSSP